MAIPRAVQRKAERARELAAQQGQPRAPAPAAHPTTVTPEPPGEQVATQVQEEAPTPDDQNSMRGQKVDPEDWETRYKRLRASGNERAVKAERRVAELETENADYRRQLADRASSAEAAPSPFELSEEERAGLSEEAQKAYELAAKKLGGQIQQKETVDEAAREAAFFADVESAVPNWEATNASADFINWLRAQDGFSGRSRLETLQAARANLDARTVTSLFRAYEGETNGSSANGAGSNTERVVVEPGRGSTVSDPRSAAGHSSQEIISQAEVQAFYRKQQELSRRKKLHGDVKVQFDAREAEIRKAYSEGRIR